MLDADKLVEKFSGFITKEQAEKILKDDNAFNSDVFAPKKTTNVKQILDYLGKERNEKDENAVMENARAFNVRDRIYRIFNPSTVNAGGRETTRRKVVLGEEGSTMQLNLRDNLSDFMDINAFERGDTVSVNNVLIDHKNIELISGYGTAINRISPSKIAAITDYSAVKEEMRKVDVIGRLVEISPIRHVSRLGASGQMAVASCTITDTMNIVDVSLWGSSAIKSAALKTNDFIKIEFCDIKSREGKLQVYANDYSRILSSNALSGRLTGKR